MIRTIRVLSVFLSMLYLSGCATIIGDKTQTIPISSTPSDALIVITDDKGAEVFKGLTPTTVTLQKSDGSYWGKKSFSVSISKTGYQSQVILVSGSPNGWYIAGNLLFGGFIGWFIVDPLNGGMYTLSPDEITSSLGATAADNSFKHDGSLTIMLIEDVPQVLRDKMTRIN